MPGDPSPEPPGQNRDFRVPTHRTRMLGRIGSTARVVTLGLQPVGLLGGGALIDLTSGSTTLAVMGIGTIGVSLVFAPLTALRGASLVPR